MYICRFQTDGILNSTADGLKYYDIVEGKGPKAEKGSTVQVYICLCNMSCDYGFQSYPSEASWFQVHFDCLYRGITAISSRESKLLAGNRSIAQVGSLTFKLQYVC